MEVLETVQANIDDYSPKKCVAYLKKHHAGYFSLLSSRCKYAEEKITEQEDADISTIPLQDIRIKAQKALLSSGSNALDNNMKLLSTHAVAADKDKFIVGDEYDKPYAAMRTQNLEVLASSYITATNNKVFAPQGGRFEAGIEPKPTNVVCEVKNVVGFICPTKFDIPNLTVEQKCTPDTLNPNAVLYASKITDLCVYVNGVWKPKVYTNNFFNGTKMYTTAASELAHYLKGKYKPAKDNLKGVELNGLLSRQFTMLFNNVDSFRQIRTIDPIVAPLYDKKNAVHFKHAMGDYVVGTPDHAHKVNQACCGIRGGDSKDNSPADYSYYVGVALPRRLAKAFVFCHDLQRLFDRIHMPIELIGKDANKRIQMLYEANTFYGMLHMSYVPKGFVDEESRGYYSKPGISFKIVVNNIKLQVFWSDMDSKTEIMPVDYAVKYCSYSDQAYFLPCTAVHTLGGFASIGRKEIQFLKITDKFVKQYCQMSLEVNKARTFFAHYQPFHLIAAKYNMEPLIPRFKQLSLSMTSAPERYDDLLTDQNYIIEILAGSLGEQDYNDVVEQYEANKANDQTGKPGANARRGFDAPQEYSGDENEYNDQQEEAEMPPLQEEEKEEEQANLEY